MCICVYTSLLLYRYARCACRNAFAITGCLRHGLLLLLLLHRDELGGCSRTPSTDPRQELRREGGTDENLPIAYQDSRYASSSYEIQSCMLR